MESRKKREKTSHFRLIMASSFSSMERVFIHNSNINKTNKNYYCAREYVAAYGVTVHVSAKIWHVLKSSDQFCDKARGLSPCHLLWCFYFLKQYSTSTVMARYCGCSDKTFRKWVWITVELLAELYDENVRKKLFWLIMCIILYSTYIFFSDSIPKAFSKR